MTADPFAAAIAKATSAKETKEAEQKAAAERHTAQLRAKKLVDFGHDFLTRVVARVVDVQPAYEGNPDFVKLTQTYSVGLLSLNEIELPKLAAKYADLVINEFEDALRFARGSVPDGHFYGQTVLAARRAEQEEQKRSTKSSDRIRIEPPKLNLDEDTTVPETSDELSGEVLDLDAARERLAGPAVTPPVKGKDKRPAAARASKASVS
jgi:hypothetical protein